MTPQQIARLDEMEAKEWRSGPFIWTADEMEEFERLRMAKRTLETAAPDLLEALKSALMPLELHQAYGWSDRARVIPKVRAAIAKAEGQP